MNITFGTVTDALTKCSFKASLQPQSEFRRGYEAAICDIEKMLGLK